MTQIYSDTACRGFIIQRFSFLTHFGQCFMFREVRKANVCYPFFLMLV